MATVILPDQPELLALAGLASVPASKMAAAFNAPDQFFEHLSLEELDRIRQACERWAVLQMALAESIKSLTEEAARVLSGEASVAD